MNSWNPRGPRSASDPSPPASLRTLRSSSANPGERGWRASAGWLLAGYVVFAPIAQAAAPVDLGQGQAYVRVHAAADLRELPPGPLVLDVRYVPADAGLAQELTGFLKARSRGAELFVLVSPATPPAVGAALASAGALTLGVPGSSPAPKVAVQSDAGLDRRAYEAAEGGTTVASLISGKIDKERYDEASLVADFNNGDRDPEPPGVPEPAAANSAEKQPRLVDRVLQRAADLHRALQALRP